MLWNVEFLYKKFILNTFENYLIKIDNIQCLFYNMECRIDNIQYLFLQYEM